LLAELLAILVCPKCKGELVHRERDSALDCPTCRLRYAIRDDIPIMLIDEATAALALVFPVAFALLVGALNAGGAIGIRW